MDKMEEALEPEDVLSCCLVLKHGHSSGHRYSAGLAPITRVLAAKLPVSAWTNCWKRGRGTKCSNFTLSNPIQHPQSTLDSQESGESWTCSTCWCCPDAGVAAHPLPHPWQPRPHRGFWGLTAVSSDSSSSTSLLEDDVLVLSSLFSCSAAKRSIGVASICTSAFWNQILPFFLSNPSPLKEPSVFHSPSKPQGAQRLMHKNW